MDAEALEMIEELPGQAIRLASRMVEALLESDVADKMAKMARKGVDAYVAEGFSEEQAISMMISFSQGILKGSS